MATQPKQSTALTSPGYLVPFVTVTALYFIFGFITNLNMQLVPHLKSVFDLPWLQGGAGQRSLLYRLFCRCIPNVAAD
jgi:fucose permease